MSPDSYSLPPTKEEIAEYIKANGFVGKVSPTGFYDYYSRDGFLYHGLPMDWQGKIRKWAQTQRTPVTITMADAALFDTAVTQPPKPAETKDGKWNMGDRRTDNIQEYLEWAVAQI